MSVVDRFICRREGHVPSLTLTPSPFVASYVSTCRRCGKQVEVQQVEPQPAPAAVVIPEEEKP